MNVMILILIALLSIIGYYIKWRIKKMSILERNGIRGPKPHTIYGNVKEMHKNGNVTMHKKWRKEYGPVYGYYIGRYPVVTVTEPELLKQIQIKEFKNFSNRFMPLKGGLHSDPRNDEMLIKVKNQRWKEMRTIMRQAFTAAKLKNSINIMDDTVNNLIATIEKKIEKGEPEFDIYLLFQGLTMETIGRSAFGITTEAQTNPNDPFLLAAKEVFEISLKSSILAALVIYFPELQLLLDPLRRLSGFMYSSASSQLLQMSSAIVESRKVNNKIERKDLLQSMIDAKVNVKELSTIDDSLLSINADMSVGEKQKEETLSDKEQSYKKMTNDEIVANTVLFFEAGYETTSTALAFVFHILVNHTDVQEKVREEVMQLLEKEGELDYNTVSQLPFMEAVIYETLRIYPPLTFFVTRVADVNFKFENFTIPSGSCIIIPVAELHHDPQFWEEPEKFDPYRFYGDNKSKTNDLIWQPFGAGPRNCIGMRFAICEMKLAIAKLLSKYRFEAGPRTEIGDINVRYKQIVMCPNHVFVKALRL